MRLYRGAAMHDERTMLKIADPQSVRVVASPAAADLLFDDAQLATRRADPF